MRLEKAFELPATGPEISARIAFEGRQSHLTEVNSPAGRGSRTRISVCIAMVTALTMYASGDRSESVDHKINFHEQPLHECHETLRDGTSTRIAEAP